MNPTEANEAQKELSWKRCEVKIVFRSVRQEEKMRRGERRIKEVPEKLEVGATTASGCSACSSMQSRVPGKEHRVRGRMVTQTFREAASTVSTSQ